MGTDEREFDLLGLAAALPASGERRYPKSSAMNMFGLALFGAIFLTVSVIHTGGLERGWPAMLFGTAITVVGLLFGINRLVSRNSYAFNPDRVAFSGRGLLGEKAWEEPLSTYRGIQYEREDHSTSTRSQSASQYTLYKLVLEHSAKTARNVTIYQSLSEDGIRQRQERYCRLFGLPALTQTADGVTERTVQDLDKSVRERAAEGSLKVGFDPLQQPPGWRLAVHIEGDTMRLSAGPQPFGLALGVLAALFGVAVFALPALGVHLLRSVPPWAGVAGLLFGAFLLGGNILVREELFLSPSEVRRQQRWPWGTFGRSSLKVDAIEDVILVNEKGNPNAQAVHIVSDTGTISFGMALSDKERRWVRDCVLAVVSK